MKTHERLAKAYTVEQLQDMQKGVSLGIDRAKGLPLAAYRRRYWTFERAISHLTKKKGG